FLCRSSLPPLSTLFPYTTLFRSHLFLQVLAARRRNRVRLPPVLRRDRPDPPPLLQSRDRAVERPRTQPRPREAFDVLHHGVAVLDRKSTRLNSSHDQISYAVFCL